MFYAFSFLIQKLYSRATLVFYLDLISLKKIKTIKCSFNYLIYLYKYRVTVGSDITIIYIYSHVCL